MSKQIQPIKCHQNHSHLESFHILTDIMASSSEEEVEYEPEDFLLCGESLTITTVAVMPLSVLARLGGSNEVSGQKLWCGSVCLSEYLGLRSFSQVAGAEVVELGAGTGAAGMLCSRRGAAKIWLTDHDQKCIKHMSADCIHNSISNAFITPFDWYRPTMAAFTRLGGFDVSLPLVLIAGDVLYQASLVEHFFTSAKMLMEPRLDSVLYLCHIPRAGVEHDIVVAGGEILGFIFQRCSDEFRLKVDTSLCPLEDIDRAHCYEIRLRREVATCVSSAASRGFGRVSIAVVTPFCAPSDTDRLGLTQQIVDDAKFIETVTHVAKGLSAARAKAAVPELIGGIITPGTTGEQHSLTIEERKALYSAAVQPAAAFDISILAGVSTTSTYDAVQLSRHAVSCGCHGIMLGLPPYLRLADAEATLYVEAVHAAVPKDFPILLYNNVGRNGLGPSLETLVSWFRRGLIYGIKHANVPSAVFISEAIAMLELEPTLRLYTGSDVSSLSLLMATDEEKKSIPRFYGLTSIIGNLYPEETALMVSGLVAGTAGDRAAAESIHTALSNVASACLLGCSLPVGLKYAMRKNSNDKLGGYCRLPLIDIGNDTISKINDALCAFNKGQNL